jgi:hypothetical protein
MKIVDTPAHAKGQRFLLKQVWLFVKRTTGLAPS